MSDERLFSLKNPWFIGAMSIVVGVALLAAAVGFIWVPYAQSDKSLAGWWDAICRAAGAPAGSVAPVDDSEKRMVASDVIVVPNMIAMDKLSIGRGATLALRCTMCHGAQGMSGANIPNLAGQNPEAIYKQMRDFQSRRRGSEIMTPHVRNLNEQDMRDLSAYYASLPRTTPLPTLAEQFKAPAIVQIGAPMRNIAPCASCHGGSDLKTATPILEGQPAAYIHAQLQAFLNGARNNDIHAQMRLIAQQMTPEEIKQVAEYYSNR